MSVIPSCETDFRKIADAIPGKNAIQCRTFWYNNRTKYHLESYLPKDHPLYSCLPALQKVKNMDEKLAPGRRLFRAKRWTEEERLSLIKLVKIHGNDYTAIMQYFPGKTRKNIKDFWHNTNRNKISLWNIVPINHKTEMSILRSRVR